MIIPGLRGAELLIPLFCTQHPNLHSVIYATPVTRNIHYFAYNQDPSLLSVVYAAPVTRNMLKFSQLAYSALLSFPDEDTVPDWLSARVMSGYSQYWERMVKPVS